jgi:replicative DNA helicase
LVKTVQEPEPDKLQPYNEQAEMAVIGSMLVDPDAILKVSSWLKPEDFFINFYGYTYEAILSLFEKGVRHDDMRVISSELEAMNKLKEMSHGDIYYRLAQCEIDTMTGHAIAWWARKIKVCSILRKYIEVAGKIARAAYVNEPTEEDLIKVRDLVETALFEISPTILEESGWMHISQIMGQNLDRLEQIQNGEMEPGYLTGLTELDKLLGGIQPGDYIILAGRPGMGKTVLALQLLTYWGRKYGAGGLVSLEMSNIQLGTRIISSDSGISSNRIRLGEIKENEWASLLQSTTELSKLPIYFDDTPAVTPGQLVAKAKKLTLEHDGKFLVIDYLQLMDSDLQVDRNRNEVISVISRACKRIARELNIPVLALSQLSRAVESRQDKRPRSSDLRDSGSLEQDADIILFIYRDEVYNPDTEFPNLAEIIVGKFRHGPTGVFSVYFKKATQQFADLEVKHQQLEY